MDRTHFLWVRNDSNSRQVHAVCIPASADGQVGRSQAVIVIAASIEKSFQLKLGDVKLGTVDTFDQFSRTSTVIWVVAFVMSFDIMEDGEKSNHGFVGTV